MNSRRGALTFLVAGYLTLPTSPLAGSEIDKVLPLPQWQPPPGAVTTEALPPGTLIGSPLIPDALLTEDDLQDISSKLQSSPPSIAEEIESAPKQEIDLSLFLPDSLLGKTALVGTETPPTPTNLLLPLGPAFLEVCRKSPKDVDLIDPDSHVSETQREDLVRFLDFHNRDAKISACVVVTDRDQIIPEGVDLSQFASGMVKERDSCLVVYPLGEPWRARLFLSNTVHEKAGADYLQSLIEDCASDAREVTDPLEQLHRFTVRLSIRLFWLEKVTHSHAPTLAATPIPPLSADFAETREAALRAAIQHSDTSHGTTVDFLTFWKWVIVGISASIVGLAILTLAWGYRRRQMRHRVWTLPEVEVPARLGGTFSGGGGAFLKYR